MGAELIFALAFGGFSLWVAMMQRRGRLQRWEEAVVACGLKVVEAPEGLRPRLKARAGPATVRIQPFGDKGHSVRVTVQVPAPPDFHKVKIQPEGGILFGREAEIGDRPFDDKFFLEGPPRLIFALLDARTRRLIMELRSQFSIASGELQAIVGRDENLTEVLRLLLDLGKRISPPFNVVERIVENAGQDPDPGVRLQNLLLLIRELSWSPETDAALHRACSDSSPEIRLCAAKQLGAEGRAVLLDLAEKLEDDGVSAEALSIVGGELPFERVDAILHLALRRRRLFSAHACLGMIASHGAAAVDRLAKVLDRESGELAPAAAEALGTTGSPAAEPALIQALQRDEVEIKVAAAHALGKVGSTEAVLPLKEAAERFDLNLRRATRQAIAEIQSRAQGASPGQLSLADGEAGRLSLSDQSGQLSLPREESPA